MKKLILSLVPVFLILVAYAWANPPGPTDVYTLPNGQGSFSAEFYCVHRLQPIDQTQDQWLGYIFADGIRQHPNPPLGYHNYMEFYLYGQENVTYHVQNTSFNNVQSKPGGGNVTLEWYWVATTGPGTPGTVTAYPLNEKMNAYGVQLKPPLNPNNPCTAYATFVVFAEWLTAETTALPGLYRFDFTLQATLEI